MKWYLLWSCVCLFESINVHVNIPDWWPFCQHANKGLSVPNINNKCYWKSCIMLWPSYRCHLCSAPNGRLVSSAALIALWLLYCTTVRLHSVFDQFAYDATINRRPRQPTEYYKQLINVAVYVCVCLINFKMHFLCVCVWVCVLSLALDTMNCVANAMPAMNRTLCASWKSAAIFSSVDGSEWSNFI